MKARQEKGGASPQEEDYRGMMETLRLLSEPGMKKKLLDGRDILLSDCVPESEADGKCTA